MAVLAPATALVSCPARPVASWCFFAAVPMNAVSFLSDLPLAPRSLVVFLVFPCAASAWPSLARRVASILASFWRTLGVASPSCDFWRSSSIVSSRQVTAAKPVFGWKTQPLVASHVSSVQRSPSAQLSAVPGKQLPSEHVSTPLHASWSSQAGGVTGVQIPASQASPAQRPSGWQSRSSAHGQSAPLPRLHFWQEVLHPVPGIPFSAPRSHASPHSGMPSPQRSRRQPGAQPSHGVVLPSSHSSPGSRMLLPQRTRRQTLSHGSPGVPLFGPSSHSSPASTVGLGLPHPATWQLSQPSVGSVLPSSHASPGSTMPLPHRGRVQLESQPSPSTTFPSSHSSVHSLRPFPHTSILQVCEQPSQSLVLPSSQSSVPSRMPLPHTGTTGPRHAGSVESCIDVGEGAIEVWLVSGTLAGLR